MVFVDQLVYGGTLMGLKPVALEPGSVLNKVNSNLQLAIVNSFEEADSIQLLCVILKSLSESKINISDKGRETYSTIRMHSQLTGLIICVYALNTRGKKLALIDSALPSFPSAFGLRDKIKDLLLKL